jgi:site-specific DNA-methyltransferase (adenine-specific)
MTGAFHIVIAMKPLDGNFADNAIRHGVAGLNIDGCRIGTELVNTHSRGNNTAYPKRPGEKTVEESGRKTRQDIIERNERSGRFPANVIHDGSDGVVKGFPESSVTGKRSDRSKSAVVAGTQWYYDNHESTEYTDSGSAARFFKCCGEMKT